MIFRLPHKVLRQSSINIITEFEAQDRTVCPEALWQPRTLQMIQRWVSQDVANLELGLGTETLWVA